MLEIKEPQRREKERKVLYQNEKMKEDEEEGECRQRKRLKNQEEREGIKETVDYEGGGNGGLRKIRKKQKEEKVGGRGRSTK